MQYAHDLDQTWHTALDSKVDHMALLRIAVQPLADAGLRFHSDMLSRSQSKRPIMASRY